MNMETQHGSGNKRSLWLQASGDQWGSVEQSPQGEMCKMGRGAGTLVTGTVRVCGHCWWKVRDKTRAVAAGKGRGGEQDAWGRPCQGTGSGVMKAHSDSQGRCIRRMIWT